MGMRINPRIGILRDRIKCWHPDAQAWAIRARANSGIVSDIDMAAQDYAARAFTAIGLNDANARVNTFAGRNLAAALTPLYRGSGPDVDTNINFVASDYVPTTGLTPDGASKSLMWANNCAGMFTATSAHMLVYRRTNGLGVDFTCNDGSNQRVSLYISAGETDAFNSTSGAGRLNFSAVSGIRLCGSSRISAASFSYYENGSVIASSTGSSGTVPTAAPCYLFSNAAVNLWSNTICGGYSTGPGITSTQAAAYAADWQQIMTMLGRSV
jgi:hypothetical protein